MTCFHFFSHVRLCRSQEVSRFFGTAPISEGFASKESAYIARVHQKAGNAEYGTPSPSPASPLESSRDFPYNVVPLGVGTRPLTSPSQNARMLPKARMHTPVRAYQVGLAPSSRPRMV